MDFLDIPLVITTFTAENIEDMRKGLLVAACVVLVMFGCKKGKEEATPVVYPDVVLEDGVYTLPNYHVSGADTVGSDIYTYDIVREPDDSLPMVTNDWGTTKDNTITLTLTRNGRKYYSQMFTKRMFQSSIDASLYESSILDGIRFLRNEKGQGMVFSLAVSEPNSDMGMAFAVTVADDGNVSFAKEDIMDVDLDDEQAPAY